MKLASEQVGAHNAQTEEYCNNVLLCNTHGCLRLSKDVQDCQGSSLGYGGILIAPAIMSVNGVAIGSDILIQGKLLGTDSMFRRLTAVKGACY